jgi:hypothetical protein
LDCYIDVWMVKWYIVNVCIDVFWEVDDYNF